MGQRTYQLRVRGRSTPSRSLHQPTHTTFNFKRIPAILPPPLLEISYIMTRHILDRKDYINMFAVAAPLDTFAHRGKTTWGQLHIP